MFSSKFFLIRTMVKTNFKYIKLIPFIQNCFGNRVLISKSEMSETVKMHCKNFFFDWA